MDSSSVYKQITNLQSEIHDLKNRQTVAEVQLECLLEERKSKQELWQELSMMIWFPVCFLLVLLITSLHHSHSGKTKPTLC